jgi:hypothetical protein
MRSCICNVPNGKQILDQIRTVKQHTTQGTVQVVVGIAGDN